jgi:hypothetical protein
VVKAALNDPIAGRIGTAATGRSRRYHYYTCSTRYRYGTRAC